MRRTTTAFVGVGLAAVTSQSATAEACQVAHRTDLSTTLCSSHDVSAGTSAAIVRVTTSDPKGGELLVADGDGPFYSCPIEAEYRKSIDSTVTEIRIDDPQEYLYFQAEGQDSGTLEIVECA